MRDGALPVLTIRQHGLVRRALHVLDEEAARIKAQYGDAVDFEELKADGKLALYECAQRFDERVCPSFEAYARFRVRGTMLDQVATETTEARVRKRMERAAAQRIADYHDDYDVLRHDRPEFLRRLDLMCDRVATAMHLSGSEQARREAGDNPEAAAAYAEEIAALETVIAPLNAEERELLDLIYASDFNLEQAGAALGVVKETAFRRIHRLLDKLRVALVALGVTHAPEPMRHPNVRPVLVPRTPRPATTNEATGTEDDHGRELDDGSEMGDAAGDPEKQR